MQVPRFVSNCSFTRDRAIRGDNCVRAADSYWPWFHHQLTEIDLWRRAVDICRTSDCSAIKQWPRFRLIIKALIGRPTPALKIRERVERALLFAVCRSRVFANAPSGCRQASLCCVGQYAMQTPYEPEIRWSSFSTCCCLHHNVSLLVPSVHFASAPFNYHTWRLTQV